VVAMSTVYSILKFDVAFQKSWKTDSHSFNIHNLVYTNVCKVGKPIIAMNAS